MNPTCIPSGRRQCSAPGAAAPAPASAPPGPPPSPRSEPQLLLLFVTTGVVLRAAGIVATGMETAGTPVRLIGTVRTSLRRREAGSAGGPQLGNGGNGVVGARRTSATERAARISRRSRFWTFVRGLGEKRQGGRGARGKGSYTRVLRNTDTLNPPTCFIQKKK